MGVQREEVRTFKERLICERCMGEFLATGECLTSHPPFYRHRCSSCGDTVLMDEEYPRIVYERAEEE